MKKSVNEQILTADISRYKKNKLGANLALLGLVFQCLYFMLIYGYKATILTDGSGTFTKFCSIDIGLSVILTLVTLLVSFLASEGVKGYNKTYCIYLLVLAVIQIAKIFGLPLYGYNHGLLTVNYFGLEPSTPGVNGIEFAILIVYLVASAACYIAAAVISYIKITQLNKHEAAVESGEINIDNVLAEMDAEDVASAQVNTKEVQ
jgi:hypothetical protein